MLNTIININKIKINYNIFFKDFLNKLILINKVKKIQFLGFKYEKRDLGF